MKHFLLLCCCVPLMAFAGVSINVKEVTISQMADAVVKGMLQRDFVMGPGVVKSDERLSMSLRDVTPEKAFSVFRQVAAGAGFSVSESDGVVIIDKRQMSVDSQPVLSDAVQSSSLSSHGSPQSSDIQEAEREARVYWPKCRTVDFLGKALKVLGVRVPESLARDAVVYAGTTDQLDKAEQFLGKLDKCIPSVSIRAVVLEVSDSSNETRSMSAVLSLLSGKLGIAYKVGSAVAGNAVTLKAGGIDAAISAIEGDSRFRYVSEPTLRASDGQKARLVVGADVPVRGGVSVSGSGTALQSIEYKTAGVVVEVTPSVLADVISLQVKQQISSFGQTTTSGIDSPTIFKRESETTVVTKDGELILLAGLDETKEDFSRSGQSFLPAFLGSRSKSSNRSQIILLLEVKRESI